jgi:glycosyltransferase involved in cell wall biosynthesis
MFPEMVRNLGLAGCVEMVREDPDPVRHYGAVDVFAVTTWEGTCPVALLENMALGNSVACFAGVGDGAGLVGDAGLVVNELSPKAMAVAIAGLADRPERRIALGAAARQRVREGYLASLHAPLIREVMRVAICR